MTHPESPADDDSAELGRRLREHRRTAGLTLQEVADRAGVSKSFVSQVEAGKVNPSVSSLKRIAATIGVQLGALLDDQDVIGAPASRRPDVAVVRRGHRKMIKWPSSDVTSSLLTPDMRRKMEVLLSVYAPGHSSGEEPITHEGEEFGLVLSGRFQVEVAGETHLLEEGDSIYYPSHLPHRMSTIDDEPAETLWVITPPSF